jgi:hypothetical protein
MPWDNDRFVELERRVKETLKGARPALDVPYFHFPYGPGDGIERTCIIEFQNMVKRLKAEDLSAETIFLSKLLLDSLRELGLLDEDVLAKESRDRKEIFNDLRGRYLKEGIVKRLIDRLDGKDASHCAVLLRAGALFPFVRISHILSGLDGRIGCVLVIPYPGSKEGEMLWYPGDGSNNYYRWETV